VTIDRRRFLVGAAAGVTGVAAAALAACGVGPAGQGHPDAAGGRRRVPAAPASTTTTPPPVVPTALPSGVIVPVAAWLVEENAKPGTIDWIVQGVQTPHAIEGYASRVSAVAGDEITLFINSTANRVHAEAYRMGYYQGLGGRLVAFTGEAAAQRQPPPQLIPGVNTVSCEWSPSLTFTVDASWPPGCYLIKLCGDGGQQQYVPLTVRDDTSYAAYVFQNSVTTWQAYNLWGSYSLYYGAMPGGGSDFANRSRIVSFDRPYPLSWAQGSADFIGNEYPLLYDMERLGLDMTYWTDVDLHVNPQLLLNHQCLFSMGHDEYWSAEMRTGAETALAQGTNLAFLGANACYRQIRFQGSAVGPNRQQICYKDAAEDPMSLQDPTLTTVNWIQDPVDQPESELIGPMYQSVRANDDLVVVDAGNWFFDGCGLTDGQVLPAVVQGEYDRYVPGLQGPRNLDVLCHSPVRGQGNWSDLTYYTQPGGGGVLASGMASFPYKLSNSTAFPSNVVPRAIPGVTPILLRAMQNLYGQFGFTGASTTNPSTANWTAVYQGAAAAAATAQGTNAA
jgi:hypothetical protein